MSQFYTIFAGLVLLIVTACPLHAQSPLHPIQSITLPGVQGRIDHIAVDVKNSRLFIAALGKDSVEVVNLTTGNSIYSIERLNEPQGIVVVPELSKIFITNGGDGSCNVYDSRSLNLLDSIRLKGDADNIRYDESTKSIFIGYGRGAIAIIDAENHRKIGDISLAGHPESFQLEKSTDRIYVNVPSARHIAIIDRKRNSVIEKWPVKGLNYPMALIESRHQLLVVTRQPSRLLILDTQTGRMIADLKCVADADDVFYDARRERIYVSGGEGVIDVFSRNEAGHYHNIARIPTAAGARTSLWVPELNRLFVAIPAGAQRDAAVWVFEGTAP